MGRGVGISGLDDSWLSEPKAAAAFSRVWLDGLLIARKTGALLHDEGVLSQKVMMDDDPPTCCTD